MLDVVEHVEDDIGSVSRTVEPRLERDGWVLVSVPAYQSLFTPHDNAVKRSHRYSPRQAAVGAAFGLLFLSVVMTSLALAVVQVAVGPSVSIELLAVTAVSAVAAVFRFAVLRTWIFRTSTTSHLALRFDVRRCPIPAP